ncbi:MAG: polysaccharide deacetylase family protein [Bacteroidales bacterium]
MTSKRFAIIAIILLAAFDLSAQNTKNLAELLGYPKASKLLIIHADDMGLSQSVNAATLKAFSSKGITSGSIMVPCPWSGDIMKYLKEHPGPDVGIHLTLTAEWDTYRWDGISSSDQIRSLLDSSGRFPRTVEELGKTAKGDEAYKELKAQIDLAIKSGINPTHIDTHMGSVLANPELVKVYLQLSEEYKLPILFPREYVGMLPKDVAAMFGSKIFLLDNLFMLDNSLIKGSWAESYRKGIESLKPGLNQIIVHLAINNDEMKAICGGVDYGSEWRQKDLDFVTGNELKEMLKANNIKLITWRQVGEAMRAMGEKK